MQNSEKSTQRVISRSTVFGGWLRQRRLERRLTQDELAQQVNCARITIQKLERGERHPSRQIVKRLADIFEIPTEAHETLILLARQRLIAEEDEYQVGSLVEPSGHGLGRSLTPLIGRERELTEACALMRRENVQLLTLAGPPGVGKTRLAQEVGGLVTFGDVGSTFISLVALRDAKEVLPAVARAIGLHDTHGDAPPDDVLERLIGVLYRQHRILILDNLEHVLGCVPEITVLLSACPALKILATSRERLRLRGEHLMIVSPLCTPDLYRPFDLDAITQTPAVALFLSVIRRTHPLFALTNENVADVVKVCVRLDGLPLAIEVVASRGHLFSPRELLNQLDHRQLLQGVVPRDIPQHLRHLRDAIAWSYALLTNDERSVLDMLGVFPGSWTAAAATAIVAGRMCQTAVLDALTSLLDKNLVQRQDVTTGETRYAMLETIREFALEQLSASDLEADVRRRFAVFFTALAEEAASHLRNANRELWLDRLVQDYTHFQAVLDWAFEHEPPIGLRLVGALRLFWSLRGYSREGRTWTERALQHLDTTVSAEIRASVLWTTGILASDQDDYASAQIYLYQSLQIYETFDQPSSIGSLLSTLGNNTHAMGDYRQAQAYHEQAIALYRNLNAPGMLAGALMNLANVVDDIGDYARAQALYEECLALYQALDDRRGWAQTLVNRGLAALHERHYSLADTYLIDGLTMSRELKDQRSITVSLVNLGQSALCQDREREAHAYFAEALATAWRAGQQFPVAYALEGLAGTLVCAGDAVRAARLVGAASALRLSIRAPLPEVERMLLDQWLEPAHTLLGEVAWAMQERVGAVLPLSAIVAQAIGETDERSV